MMPEMQNIEWKEIWKDDYLAWICGFANAQGGTLYIGKNDTGKVTGISNSQKLLEDLPNKIRDALGIIIPVNLLIEDGKEYIEISVPTYPISISYKGSYMIKFTAPEDRIIRFSSQPVTAKVTAKERDILNLIQENPHYSMQEIADKLSISRKTVATRIKSLKEHGILERIGATKNGYWKINEQSQ